MKGKVTNSEPSKGKERKITIEVCLPEEITESNDNVVVSIRRKGKSDERYIKELERSNSVLNSENRRLTKLLTHYQEIISIGLKSAGYEKNAIFGNR